MRVSRVLGWILMSLGLAAGAAAQDTKCRETETATECLWRLAEMPTPAPVMRAPAPAVRLAVLDEGREAETLAFAASNTGSPSADTGRTSSTTDFSNPFLAFLETAGFGTREGETLNFSHNHRFGTIVPTPDGPKPRNTLSVTLQVKDPTFSSAADKYFQAHTNITKPKLGATDDSTFKVAFEMLKLRQAENAAALVRVYTAGRASAQKALGELERRASDQNDGSNATAKRILGRAVVPSAAAALSFDADEDPSDPLKDEIAGVGLALFQMAVAGVPDSAGTGRFRALRAQPEAVLEADYQRFVDATSEELATASTAQVARDRQFYFEASYHRRADLVGADEIGGSVDYEMPLLRRAASVARQDAREKRTALVADNLHRLFSENKTKEDDGPRLKIIAGYRQVRTWAPQFENASVATPIPSSHVITGSLVGGWKVNVDDVRHSAKIDLNATYENDSSDEKKRDRFIASLAFTQKLTDTLTLPITIVYANHERYRPDADHRLSALFGLNYKILRTK